ncbi:MAG: T9SS type A sorting domain-containing protein [Bacteroidetes bacterium]|nr:T9SS type A sorting domain-containing protein [Bacteroidota bacterium]
MIKKILSLCLCITISQAVQSQSNLDALKGRTCATPVPSEEWNNWFNSEVEKTKAQMGNQKVNSLYTIPIIVHIIHNGQAVGVADNISQAQVIDQLNILNADFAGTGLNNGNAPAAFAPVKADCQVQFCLAVKDPTGGILPQPGIDRIDRNAKGWTAGPYTSAYIDGTMKPNTIWDPIRYCNVWIMQLGGGLLGYATFPAGTTLAGVTGGGSSTTDGVVILNTSFGSIGTATVPPYHKGRTLTHELGHWVGLRHVWGDGNCLTDYCNDTPTSKAANFGCPAAPANVNQCGPGTSPSGEMTMNFMDYTDDLCMYMFTLDQKTRVQTAMSQGTYRNLLGTHGLCTNGPPPPPAPAIAAFNLNSNPCVGQPFTPNNTSSGGPTPTYVWSSSPSASFNPNPNVASPAITFTAPGNYVITVVATNTAGTSSYSMAVNGVTLCPKQPVCIDTLSIIKNTDTLKTYIAPLNPIVLGCQSGYAGFLTGTNCYKDKEYAQFYPPNTYSDTPQPQVNSMIVLFNKAGTKATSTTQATQINCKVYSGSAGSGPTSQLGTISAGLGAIAGSTPTNQVAYCGNPNYVFASAVIIPYVFNFSYPVIVPATGFYAAVETPFNSSVDSIQIFSDTKTNLTNDSSSWVLQYSNNWRTLRYGRNAKVHLAILPQISCRPTVGMPEYSEFVSNINVMPNPGSGLFNLIFTFTKEQKVSVKIYDCLGQVISLSEFSGVSKNAFDVDLTSKADGIYFIEISNGRERTTKKVVLAH